MASPGPGRQPSLRRREAGTSGNQLVVVRVVRSGRELRPRLGDQHGNGVEPLRALPGDRAGGIAPVHRFHLVPAGVRTKPVSVRSYRLYGGAVADRRASPRGPCSREGVCDLALVVTGNFFAAAPARRAVTEICTPGPDLDIETPAGLQQEDPARA